MKKYVFEASRNFDEMVEELGINAISDLDIYEEATGSNIEYKKLETWEYKNGTLEIYAEETEEEKKIDELLEKYRLNKEEVEFIEESSIVENFEYMGMANIDNTSDYLWHVKLYGQDEEHSVVADSSEF